MEREWGVPSEEELTHCTVIHELMVTLGIAKPAAERLVELATRLATVLPDTLAALEAGRIDYPRAEVLSQETKVLDDAGARAVETVVLQKIADADGPWQGLSPRQWRNQIQRAVVQVDIDAARRRREAAIRDREVRAWPRGDGTGVLQIIGQDTDIAFADSGDHRPRARLARHRPGRGDVEHGPAPRRRVTGSAAPGRLRRPAPEAPAPRDREVGIVLHADTLFGDGPAHNDPGELRGLGAPAPIDPHSAAVMARDEIAAGAATRVLLVDREGVLQRTIRLPKAPPGGWTRDLLNDQVRKTLPDLPDLQTDSYEPTVAITDHVRAVHPRCTSYDCARLASRCDLDHDESWPRGPTSATNLCPRCRRHHELKTRGLVRTRLHPDGSVTTTTLLGTTVTTRPDPVPGHGAGEAYARRA